MFHIKETLLFVFTSINNFKVHKSLTKLTSMTNIRVRDVAQLSCNFSCNKSFFYHAPIAWSCILPSLSEILLWWHYYTKGARYLIREMEYTFHWRRKKNVIRIGLVWFRKTNKGGVQYALPTQCTIVKHSMYACEWNENKT